MSVLGANGSTAVLNWRSKDTIYNHTNATLSVPNGLFRTSNQGWTTCNAGLGKPTTFNEGIVNFYDAQFHAGSVFINKYLINVAASPAPGLWMAAWEFHNYGCVIGGNFEFNSKSNNSGNNESYVHDGSKIYSSIVVTSSSHSLIGVDDDNSNGNNACVYSTTNITNAGTITGEFNLNDPDGVVPGTVGPNVTLGTNNCGGGVCAAPTCAISGVSATPGTCNSGNNQYTLTGNVTFSNAPSSGTLTISVSGGGSQVINAPFTSPTSYSIAGLTSDGVSHTVTAVFSADPSCTNNASYTAPASCQSGNCGSTAFTYPNYQTLGWQSSPLNCGTNNSNNAQTFNNWLGIGVNATFTYSTNMWDGDAPNIYVASPASGGCDNTFNTTINDPHCASNYHGALRFTGNNQSSGETFIEVTFSSPVIIDLARVGSISRLSAGGNYEWLHVITYDDNNAIVPISTSNMTGGYMDCSNNITAGSMNFISDGSGGVYVNSSSSVLQTNGLYGHADISVPGLPVKKIRFEHWVSGSNSNPNLRVAAYSSVIMNVLCVTPACVKPDAGPDLASSQNNCINLVGTNPTSGTWTALPSNPSGATLGTTTAGIAQVCFSGSALGSYGFIYSISSGCEDTMYVVVNSSPTSPCSNSTLWAINEDDGHLFSVLNWSSQTGVNTTTTDWGLIKWSTNNCATSTNINASGGSELESAAWDGTTNEYYFTSNKTLGSYTKPVLLKLDMNNLILGQQPCAVVIGSIATGGADIESLAIDPATGILYGGTKNGGDLYRINRNTAAIETGYPVQMVKPGGGNLNNSESMAFDYSGNLYVSETDDKDVYIIDKLTGVGISTFDNNTAPLGLDGITWDFSGNRLIGFEDNSGNGFSNLIEITPGNGNNITIANTFSAGLVDIEGLELACPIVGLSCLGNYVWNDVNQDGVQNNNEVGVSGVTVSLLNGTTDAIISTLTTDAYGFYQFCNLNAGDYKVKFSLPSNYIFTGQNAPNDATDSDPNVFTGITDLYTLDAGDSNMTVDAGIYQPLPTTATVGDRVWFDLDGDGVQDSGESGISGITVILFNCANPNVPVSTTITDAGGNYLFENVLPGSYKVGFSVPIGMILTTQIGVVSDIDNSDPDPLTERTMCFPVMGGDNITYVDAGLKTKPITTSSIGDKVWNDANQNGIQDANETGVQGVLVTLYDATGTTVISTSETNALGNYGFNGISSGCYVLGFGLPAGYTRTLQGAGSDTSKNSDANVATGMTSQICITAGQNNPTIDAGIYNAANTNSIGDRVWYDVNHDGIQDPSEYGFPGVVVTLYDCATNTIMATTTTNANGNYLFDGIANGSYYVGFGFVTGYQFTGANADVTGVLGGNNSDANPSSGLTACVTLAGNTNITSIDAGIYPGNTRNATSSLGDIVWTDANNNGLQDNGETGVSGVKVTLYEADGTTIIDTTTTDGLGNYIFTNLDGGNYVIGFSNLPSGYTFTTQSGSIENEANSDANVTTGKTTVIALGLGEDKMTVDAGLVAPVGTVCLGDYVWIDLNNDGTQDANEPAVPGITVKLYDNNSNTILQRATTNSVGQYMFCGLTIGNTYSVGFENLPAGYEFTTQIGALSVADNSDANPLTGRTTTLTLGASNDLTLDAGIYSPTTAVVGNYVWYDEDADGIQDPTEAPIPGVLVTLYDNTNTPVASAVTDANGGYLFTNVAPGTYTIGFEGYPSTLIPTTKGTNSSADDDSNIDPITGRTDAFIITPGSSNLTLDAGYKANPIAGLGNYVWYDINENGLQDASEPGISGVIVSLFESDGSTLIATAITDGNGAYSFPNLPAGSYVVGFTAPAGYTRTKSLGGLNDALNSDVDVTNKTAVVTLIAGEYNPNIDAGYYIGIPLPAKVLQATLANMTSANTCEVSWYTKDEENTQRFEIERGVNSQEFEKVATHKASGQTFGLTNYSVVDDLSTVSSNAVVYYRIKLIDIDGKFTYSNVISAVRGSSNDALMIYPNPFENALNIDYVAESDDVLELTLTDLSGRVVSRMQKTITKGANKITWNNLGSLSSGQYYIKVSSLENGNSYLRKLNK
jgi:hypothetical protein